MRLSRLGIASCLLIAGCVFSPSLTGDSGLWDSYAQSVRTKPGARSLAPADAAIEEEQSTGTVIFLRQVLGEQEARQYARRCVEDGCARGGAFQNTIAMAASRDHGAAIREAEDEVKALASGAAERRAAVESARLQLEDARLAPARARLTLHAFRARAPTPEDEIVIPQSFTRSKFIVNYARAIADAPVERESNVEMKLERKDLVQFSRAALKLATNNVEAEKSRFGRVLRVYLGAYLKGKFVDRTGRPLPEPSIVELSGGSVKVDVGNQAISGFTVVALEALFDVVLETPVYADGTGASARYFNATGKEPSACAFFRPAFCRTIEKDSRKEGGITEMEAQLANRVATVAAIQSRNISAIVFGLVKEGKLYFVGGADFAIGDHETLKVFIETLFEVSSRRLTESLAIRGLRRFQYTQDPETGQVRPAEASDNKLGRLIALFLEEQHLLDRIK